MFSFGLSALGFNLSTPDRFGHLVDRLIERRQHLPRL